MKQINFAAFVLILVLLIMGALTAGFTRGFVGFLLYVIGVGLVTWGYWRLVVSRPRVASQRAFVGVYGGLEYYMEVL